MNLYKNKKLKGKLKIDGVVQIFLKKLKIMIKQLWASDKLGKENQKTIVNLLNQLFE